MVRTHLPPLPMLNSILNALTLAMAFALIAPATLAQDVVVDTLFTFEGDDGNGDTQGWVDVQDADDANTEENSDVKVVTEKAISGTEKIPAFEGTYLLEVTPDRPLKARSFRGGKYTWATPQDWSNRSLLKVAASMNARGANSLRHEFRLRVISGSGVDADTTEKVFESTKDLEFDSDDNNTFINEWQVLEFDLSEDTELDLTQITSIEAAGRNVDDGTEPGANGETTPGPDGNWGGNVHVDLVTIEGENPGGGTFAEAQPGLNSLSNAYPNPAARSAALDLDVEIAQTVSVHVMDVLGRAVQTAFDGTVASTATLTIDTASLAPGTYVVLVQGETFTQSRRLTVSR